MKRLRATKWNTKKSPDGQPVYSFGIRVGYWPCLLAPFISVSLGTFSYDVWFGLPQKEKPGR